MKLFQTFLIGIAHGLEDGILRKCSIEDEFDVVTDLDKNVQ